MTYIADLATYDYGSLPKDPKLLAIGWLDRTVPYTTGVVDSGLQRKIFRLTKAPVVRTRGFHFCQYCIPELTNRFDERVARGDGEIRVPGRDGIIYAAPDLVFHYIERHNYRPPDEFLVAVGEMKLPSKIAIVAALERELQPLVKTWRKTAVQHEGRNFVFYESDYAVAVCGGIGAESARRAAEVAVRNYSPDILISAGVAGALTAELHVGETIFPAVVIDTGDGSRHETAIGPAPVAKTALGRTVLATYPDVATAAQKHQLSKSYGAHAVDMEAAAVARAAESHNLPFIAVKAISDEVGFEIPGLGGFVRNGEFRTGAFVAYVGVRPWLWLATLRLARNTKLASENLCAWLRESALTHTIVAGQQSTGGQPVPHNPKLG